MQKKAYNLDFDIRRATEYDIDRIQDLLYPDYFNETIFKGLTYNPENTRLMVEGYVKNKYTMVAEAEGEIVGFTSLLVGNTFYDEVEADVEFFCVRSDFRGSAVARALAGSVLEAAEELGATVFYAACASGIDEHNDALWKNLWSKFGFKKLGTVMIRG